MGSFNQLDRVNAELVFAATEIISTVVSWLSATRASDGNGFISLERCETHRLQYLLADEIQESRIELRV